MVPVIKTGHDRCRTEELLDPGGFHDQAELSYTLPSTWYYEPEIYRLEHDAIFYQNWWYQCHRSELAAAGDCYRGSVADRQILIRRGRQGAIDAVVDDTGFVTPVGANPDKRRSGPVRIEDYGGFLFANFDPEAISLAEQSPKFLRDMYDCCPRLDELVHARRFEREIAANWKTVIDNNHECYHCAANHPSLMQLVDYRDRALWSNDAVTFSHRVEALHADNTAYAVDPASRAQESLFGYVWPNLIPLFFPGTPGLVMFQVLPLAPERTLVRHDFYFLEREPSAQEEEFMHWFSNVLNVEDIDLCENVQRGLHSRGYHQGRFVVDRDNVGISEHHVHFFQQLVLHALQAAHNR